MADDDDGYDYDDDASSSVFDFDALCEALQRNDPNFTTVDVVYDDDRDDDAYCPQGYGPRLGRAIRNNTCVESIELNLGFILRWDVDQRSYDEGSGDDVHHFLRHSTSLRTVKLRTSCGGNWERFMYECETLSFRKAILAVAENLHGPIALFLDRVERLASSFHPDVAPDLLVEALRVTTSMEELVVWLGDGGDPGYGTEEGFEEGEAFGGNAQEKAAARKQLADAFGYNGTLKRLTILDSSDERSVRVLVPALRRNGSLLSVACSAFTPIEATRVQTYCTRNQGVLDLLAAFVHDRMMDVTNNDEDSENARARRLLIMPSFFAVVQHSPSMAYCRVVRGLQALTGGAGPSVSDGKRSR